MNEAPRTRYARRGDIRIAYQVVGDGPIDLVHCNDHVPIDIMWEEPMYARYLRRLASFSRVICYDHYGVGASDQPVNWESLPILEETKDDVLCVMDAVGSERAAIFGDADGGGYPACFFAASHPERVSALVLANSAVKYLRSDDFPWGLPSEVLDDFLAAQEERWGTGANLDVLAPSYAKDDRISEFYAATERLTMRPGLATRTWHRMMMDLDLRQVLPAIRVPTLVIQIADNAWVRSGHGRYLAEHIPDSRYVELPGNSHLVYLAGDEVLDEIEVFLTGVRRGPKLNRVLVTLLFTDIVRSTQKSSELGDAAWRALLDEHDKISRAEIEHFGGREVKSTGDGFLTTFDGPARAIGCALSIREAMGALGIQLRFGLHAGEVEIRGQDVGGIAVHIAERVTREAAAGDIVVSGSLPPLVAGSGIQFEDLGTRKLQGVPEDWRLFRVKD